MASSLFKSAWATLASGARMVMSISAKKMARFICSPSLPSPLTMTEVCRRDAGTRDEKIFSFLRWKRSLRTRSACPNFRLVCLLVVRVGMDDERGASWLEERGPACRQGHAGGRHVDRTRPVGSHREIGKVSGVGAFGVLVAMLLAVGI